MFRKTMKAEENELGNGEKRKKRKRGNQAEDVKKLVVRRWHIKI